jgi:hypothetical protein
VVPVTVWAQSAIAGVVRDTSGAVLPGATVEAVSPVLIEKVRSVITDEAGQYKIVDLRPGNYTVTFSLAGFGTVKRDGIELPANFTQSARMLPPRWRGPISTGTTSPRAASGAST